MIPALRRHFNNSYDPKVSQKIRLHIESVTGEPISFPLSTTPVFIPRELLSQLEEEIFRYTALIRTKTYKEEAVKWVPAQYRCSEVLKPLPSLSIYDFSLGLGSDGKPRPYLLECQGISSLHGVIPWFGELLTNVGELKNLTPFLSHRDFADYLDHLQSIIKDSILIDVNTSKQTFRTDFWTLRHFIGIEVQDLTFENIERLKEATVYSRIVPTEAEEKLATKELLALYREKHNWVVEPEWFYMLSKASLPSFSRLGKFVPRTKIVTKESISTWPKNLPFVLKPVDSYGGREVKLQPTTEDLKGALKAKRPWVLQEKITFAPIIFPPSGRGLFTELRVLMIEDRPSCILARLGIEPLMNVCYNKHYPWCGMTVGLIER